MMRIDLASGSLIIRILLSFFLFIIFGLFGLAGGRKTKAAGRKIEGSMQPCERPPAVLAQKQSQRRPANRRTWRLAIITSLIVLWLVVIRSIGLSVTLQAADNSNAAVGNHEDPTNSPPPPRTPPNTSAIISTRSKRRGMTGVVSAQIPATAARGHKHHDDNASSFPGDYYQKPATANVSYAFLLLVNAPVTTTTTNNSSNTTKDENAATTANVTTNAAPYYYRGFLYNILVAIYTLKESGSTADFVVYIRMTTTLTTTTTSTHHAATGTNDNNNSSSMPLLLQLPRHEMEWLDRLGCRIIYLPPATVVAHEDFRTSQFYKFYILDLIEYERVLYLDADILPLCNLDYIFRMSTTTTTTMTENANSIKENLVLAWLKEPANGGFFMLKPGIGELDALHRIIEHQQEKQQQQQQQQQQKRQRIRQQLQQGTNEEDANEDVMTGGGGGGFDEILGWGHAIQKPDRWMAFQRKYVNTKWNFYAAYGDQGLLYHWVKYHKQSVTLVYGVNAEDWGHNDTALVRERVHQPFANQSCMATDRPAEKYKGRYAMHPAYGKAMVNKPPYSDFLHFYGPFKPFENLTLAMMALQRLPHQTSKYDSKSSLDYFFWQLRKVNHALSMGLDFQAEEGHLNMAAAAALPPKQWMQELQAPPLEQRRVPRKKRRTKQFLGS